MVAPPAAADIHPPCPAVVEQPTEEALVSESTLSQLGFPNEFPYEFDSSAFNSPGDSTETEGETSDDEDDFLAGLTRRLALSTQRLPSPPSLVTEKAEVKPANSTLSGLGSCSNSGNRSPNGPFSQVPSPPTSPFSEEDSLKVISAAAGEVAKIKMAHFDAKPNSRPNPNPSSFVPIPQNAAFCDHYYYYYWLWQPQSPHYHQSRVRFVSTLQPALIASPYPVRGVFAAPTAVRGVVAAPTAVKQTSVGTGVFLPRKYPNPSDSRKKAGGGPVKSRSKVVHQQNPKVKEFSGRCQPHSQSQSQSRLSTGRSQIDYVAGGSLKEERHHLPKEWMY